MVTKLIDLSQEIYQGMPVFPPHQKTMIFPNMSHEQAKEELGFEFATNNLLINEHGPTHTDAIYEFDHNGPTIDEMGLDHFYGPAVCIDLTHVSPDHYITKEVLEEAVRNSDQVIQAGDIVLLCTGHYKQFYGTPYWLTRHTGLNYKAAQWLAQKGVKNIGIDAPSIDQPKDTDYSGHLVCREYQLTNTENLCNLEQVVNKRFVYMGLPLKIRKGTGSPIRAVALVVD